MNNTERRDKGKIVDLKYVDPRIIRDRILTKPAGDSSGNAAFGGVAWAHQAVPRQYGRSAGTMTITDYFVALGGMLASLGCAGFVAAGLIRVRSRHQA